VHAASQQPLQRWVAVELRAEQVQFRLRLNHMAVLIYLLRVWAAWSRAIMARLDNVVLVCGGGAEALDVLVGDGAAAAVHCMRMQRAVLVSRAERRVRRQLPRAPCVERQQQPLGPAPPALRPSPTAHRAPSEAFFPFYF